MPESTQNFTSYGTYLWTTNMAITSYNPQQNTFALHWHDLAPVTSTSCIPLTVTLCEVTLTVFVPDLPKFAFLSQYSGFVLAFLKHFGIFGFAHIANRLSVILYLIHDSALLFATVCQCFYIKHLTCTGTCL